MASITIKWQSRVHHPDNEPDKRRLFVVGLVSGADADKVGGVTGRLVHAEQTTHVVDGKTLIYARGGVHIRRPTNAPVGAQGNPRRDQARWTILFDVPTSHPDGTYILTVNAWRFSGIAATVGGVIDNVDKRLRDEGELVRVSARTGIVIDPDVSPDKDLFIASGPVFQNHEAVSATMNGIDAEYVGTEDGVWVAVFPPLESGHYHLVATNNFNHSDGLELDL